jgi:hypothetical protein
LARLFQNGARRSLLFRLLSVSPERRLYIGMKASLSCDNSVTTEKFCDFSEDSFKGFEVL